MVSRERFELDTAPLHVECSNHCAMLPQQHVSIWFSIRSVQQPGLI